MINLPAVTDSATDVLVTRLNENLELLEWQKNDGDIEAAARTEKRIAKIQTEINNRIK